jgi:hypothetical protein
MAGHALCSVSGLAAHSSKATSRLRAVCSVEDVMRRMKTIGTWVGAIAITVMGAACSERAENSAAEAARETQEAASDAARAAGDAAADAARVTSQAASDAARATGEAASDATAAAGAALDNAGRAADAAVETMDVKAALVADTRIDASGVNVDTNHNTKTVVLKGVVPTAAQKTLAEQIAMKQAAGYRIQNNLAVGAAR